MRLSYHCAANRNAECRLYPFAHHQGIFCEENEREKGKGAWRRGGKVFLLALHLPRQGGVDRDGWRLLRAAPVIFKCALPFFPFASTTTATEQWKCLAQGYTWLLLYLSTK